LALDALPASAPIRMMTTAISLAAAIESVLPVPRRYLMNPTAL
jgi:hypothetical protein